MRADLALEVGKKGFDHDEPDEGHYDMIQDGEKEVENEQQDRGHLAHSPVEDVE